MGNTASVVQQAAHILIPLAGGTAIGIGLRGSVKEWVSSDGKGKWHLIIISGVLCFGFNFTPSIKLSGLLGIQWENFLSQCETISNPHGDMPLGSRIIVQS